MASRFPVPFSFGRSLSRIDPLFDLHREMNRLFDDVLSGTGSLAPGSSSAGLMAVPRIDVQEDEREICISAELPGVKPSEVDLRLEGDMLTISGEKKSESERSQQNYHVMERSYGRFQRTVQLPFAPDPQHVRADSHQGVLTIHLPKQAQQERSRRIEVRDAGSEPGEQRDEGTAVGVEGTPSGQGGASDGTTHH